MLDNHSALRYDTNVPIGNYKPSLPITYRAMWGARKASAIMNPAITDYIEKIQQPWQAEICTKLREIVFQALPGVEERMQYSKPHYLKNGKYAYVMSTAKGWVSFTIFNAEKLETPEGLFEASDTGDRKTIKIKQGQAVDYDLLAKLIQQTAKA